MEQVLILHSVTETGGSNIKTNGYSFQIKEGATVKTTVTSSTNTYNYTGGTRGKSYTATVTVTDNAGNPSVVRTSNSVTIPIEKLEDIATTTSGDGLYSVPHSGMSNAEFNKTELRYAGKDPANYVTFNGETAGWRIIGLVNVKLSDGTYGQRIKLIRKTYYSTSIAWDNNNTNDWTASTLQKALNSTYYNNNTKNYIDTVIWNLGGTSSYTSALVTKWYSSERGTTVYNGNEKELDFFSSDNRADRVGNRRWRRVRRFGFRVVLYRRFDGGRVRRGVFPVTL